jgi:hypothetical protein
VATIRYISSHSEQAVSYRSSKSRVFEKRFTLNSRVSAAERGAPQQFGQKYPTSNIIIL